MKKTTYLLCILMAFCLILSGCQSSEAVKDFAPSDLAKELTSKVTFEDTLAEIDPSMFYTLYDLDETKIEAATVWMGSGATAEEIAVFKATDTSYSDTMKAAIDQRIENKKKDYEDYMPKEMPKLDDPAIVVKGQYAVLCISGDDELARQVIEDFMKA